MFFIHYSSNTECKKLVKNNFSYCTTDEFVINGELIEVARDDKALLYCNNSIFILAEGLLFNEGNNAKQSEGDAHRLFEVYEQYKEKLFEHIDGKFSFVILDLDRHICIGAIDRFGEKKLCYFGKRDNFCFSTSAKLLAKVTDNDEINRDALAFFFVHHYIAPPLTIYQGIYKIKPSYYVKPFENFCEEIYYFPFDGKSTAINDMTEEQAETIVIESLKNSILKRINAGAINNGALLLSGGIDSSVLCYVLSRHINFNFTAYTARFLGVDSSYDESSAASIAAKSFGVQHKIIDIDIDSFQQYVIKTIKNTDEPMANKSYAVVSFLMDHLSPVEKCLFTGDGGDELFLGYPKYQKSIIAQDIYRLTHFIYPLLHDKLAFQLLPSKLRTILEAGAINIPDYLFNMQAVKQISEIFPDVPKEKMLIHLEDQYLSNKWYINMNRKDLILGAQGALRKWNDIADLHNILHFSCFLDKENVEACNSIPEKYKMHKGHNKIILRNIVNNYVPQISSLPKHGFTVPVKKWLQTNLREEMVALTSKEFIEQQGIFSYSDIDNISKAFYAGDNDGMKTLFLWNYYAFQNWYLEEMK